MGKRAQSNYGMALAAFTAGRISREEYKMVCLGQARMGRGSIWFYGWRMVKGRPQWYRDLNQKGYMK